MLKFTDLVGRLPASIPFVAPEETERQTGRPFKARLGANESVFGPSPMALAAMKQAASESWQYGDPGSFELCAALANHHGIAVDRIRVGEGIDGLLGLVVRMMVASGDIVVTSAGAYPTFNYHVAGVGGSLHMVPYRDDHEDPEALADAARQTGAKLVYLSNPDNPMGTWHPAERVMALLHALPSDCMLCLDEAYVEFAPEGTAPEMGVDDPRLMRFRTFSKARGMAGLRIGYVVGSAEMAAGLDRIRNHFGVNRVAQAGALASLSDTTHLASVQAEVSASKAEIAAIATRAGLTTLPSATNFVAVDCGGLDAARIMAELAARDVFVRMPGTAPLNRCIRVSCGRPGDLELLEFTLIDSLETLRHPR